MEHTHPFAYSWYSHDLEQEMLTLYKPDLEPSTPLYTIDHLRQLRKEQVEQSIDHLVKCGKITCDGSTAIMLRKLG